MEEKKDNIVNKKVNFCDLETAFLMEKCNLSEMLEKYESCERLHVFERCLKEIEHRVNVLRVEILRYFVFLDKTEGGDEDAERT